MFLKKIKKASMFFLLTLFILPQYTLAYSDKVYVGGENIGIEIKTNGVLIVGSYLVDGKDLSKEAGLETGDLILKLNGEEVTDIENMVSLITNSNDNQVKVTYKRDNDIKTTTLTIIKDENNIYKTGLYVKDSITGIGTLTFIDPESKIFGALGHEVADSKTGIMLEVKEGKIFSSTVTSIDRSDSGNPGCKNASLDTDDQKGTITENTASGIFGTYSDEISKEKLYNVANEDQIKKGEATILTVTESNEIKEYKIQILKIDKDENSLKNILFEITDEELLERTGGIVQGMSGSPIIQGDYIVGAVTHVVVNNPKRGYGIFITKMLEESEN
jgi:stage IV sporulation protein B